MILRYFATAQKWAFALGGNGSHPVQLDGCPLFFATFDDALKAAARKDWTVGPFHHVDTSTGKAVFSCINMNVPKGVLR